MFFLKTLAVGRLQHQSPSELDSGVHWCQPRRDSVFYNCLQEKGDAQRSQRKTYCWETRWSEVPNGGRSARLVSARPGQQGHTEELVLQVNNMGHLQPQRTLLPNPIQRLTLNLEVTEIGNPGCSTEGSFGLDFTITTCFKLTPLKFSPMWLFIRSQRSAARMDRRGQLSLGLNAPAQNHGAR
ncbi:hypothetical protein mRhiFer1_009516 [Rhinolophus ferrumequinum]|uniref:Uncharacterized protein n=1 Tax=Rhinolophus ferrumequinum TaxID=59479 RepID=A0A7J7RAR5_RHIFE|nr:hypothetical protein mRhiFer1_009516 [Rhinolophus ferrumequinum]